MARIRGEGFRELSFDEDLELMCGPFIGPNWPDDRDDHKVFIRERSNFDSEEERREAWYANRERLIEWSRTGRPWAAEHYEGKGD